MYVYYLRFQHCLIHCLQMMFILGQKITVVAKIVSPASDELRLLKHKYKYKYKYKYEYKYKYKDKGEPGRTKGL